MTIRNTRRGLWLIAVIAFGGGVAVLFFGFTGDNAALQSDDARLVTVSKSNDDISGGDEGLSLEAMRGVWSLDLQRPLYDPPPPPPPKVEKFVPPPLNLRLLGTTIEPPNSQAIVMTASGEIEFRRVGDRIGEATVQSIESDRMELMYYDEVQTLEVER